MKRAFKMKQKTFFINFQGFSVAKTCLRPETRPLKEDFCFGVLVIKLI